MKKSLTYQMLYAILITVEHIELIQQEQPGEKRMFTAKLTPMTLADCVENQLLNFMCCRQLKAGDVLPREEELAAHLNVSRHIVREGISRLKALDLVESRKRKGLVVKTPYAFSGLKKLVEVNLFTPEERRELNEIRLAMEIGLCDFIYMRKTPEKIQELRKLTGSLGSYHYSSEQEVEFHSCLVGIAGNRQVSQFRDILLKIFSEKKITVNPENKPSTHLEICDTLEHGTIEEFRQVMRQHFVNIFNE